MFTWLAGLRVCWLAGWLVGWFTGLLVGWLAGWLVYWLPGLPVGWLAGLLICLFAVLNAAGVQVAGMQMEHAFS